MKKNNLVILLLMCVTLLFTACNTVTEKPPEQEWEGLDVSWNGKIMVDDKLYFYTSYEIPVETEEKKVLGKIKSFVNNYEEPNKNGQANFDIKGSKYARYEKNIAVLINGKWILFINQEDWQKGTSISNVDFLYEKLGDDKSLKLLRRISIGVQINNDYKTNLDTIIEKAFRDCDIDDSLLLDEVKSNIIVTLLDSK